MQKNQLDPSRPFDKTPIRYRQTDRQTDRQTQLVPRYRADEISVRRRKHVRVNKYFIR